MAKSNKQKNVETTSTTPNETLVDQTVESAGSSVSEESRESTKVGDSVSSTQSTTQSSVPETIQSSQSVSNVEIESRVDEVTQSNPSRTPGSDTVVSQPQPVQPVVKPQITTEDDIDHVNDSIVRVETKQEESKVYVNIYNELIDRISISYDLHKHIFESNKNTIKQITSSIQYESILNYTIRDSDLLLKDKVDYTLDEKKSIANVASRFVEINLILQEVYKNQLLKSDKEVIKYNSNLSPLLLVKIEVDKLVRDESSNVEVDTPKQTVPTTKVEDDSDITEIFDNRVDNTPRENFTLDVSELPDETLSGEATAYHSIWFYEGINDHNADTRLSGSNINRASKTIVKSIRTIVKQISEKMSRQLVSSDYRDKSITYQKLSDDVKRRISAGGRGSISGFTQSIDYDNMSRGVGSDSNYINNL